MSEREITQFILVGVLIKLASSKGEREKKKRESEVERENWRNSSRLFITTT